MNSEVMDNASRRARCPGGQYCDCEKCNDHSEFQKMLVSKKGLVIYRHNQRNFEHDDGIEVATKPSYTMPCNCDQQDTSKKPVGDNIVIIIQNTKDQSANAADFLHELDYSKVNCPRCREIMKRAKKMLTSIATVENKETIGTCELCRLQEPFRAPCKYCRKTIEKFKSTQPTISNEEEDMKNKLVSLLTRGKTNVIIMKGNETLRAYSDVDVTARKITAIDQILGRPKSGTNFYEKAQTTRHKPCKCFLEKHMEAKKIVVDVKTQVDLKKSVSEKVKVKYDFEHKTPYHFGLQSESVLGVGTTGIVRRSHSDETLVTSISGINEEILKKNFKYFFPGAIKKKEVVVKSSEELIRDTKERFQAETKEKIKIEEERKLILQEKQREKEIAIEEIKRKTEWARRERIPDGVGTDKGDSIVSKKSEMVGKKSVEKVDKKTHEPKQKEKAVQSMKEKERPEKKKEEGKEHITSTERRSKMDKDKESGRAKGDKKIEETETTKGKEKGQKYDEIKREKKMEQKPKDKEDRFDKIKEGKTEKSVQTERKPKEKDERIDKGKKEKFGPDLVRTEQKPKDKGDKVKEEKTVKSIQTERKPKDKEENIKRKEEKREIPKIEKPVKDGKTIKPPDRLKEPQKTKDTEKSDLKAKENDEGKKSVKEIGKKGREKGEQIRDDKGDGKDKVKKEVRKEKDVKPPPHAEKGPPSGPPVKPPPVKPPPVKPPPYAEKGRPSGPPGITKPPEETKTKAKRKIADKEETTEKKEKPDKKEKKSEEGPIVKDKAESKSKGAPFKDEAKVLDEMLKKKDKLAQEAMKAKQLRDAKFAQDMKKADSALAKKAVKAEEPVIEFRDIKKIKEKQIIETEKKVKKAEEKKDEKPAVKQLAEIGFKDVKYVPSGDDLILKLVKTAGPIIREIKSLPTLEPPKAPRVIRRLRRKPSICSLRSELALDDESLLRKRMESKKVVEPEIIYGENIYFEKDIPPEPEHEKPTVFETAYKYKNIESVTEREPTPEIKPVDKGIFRYTLSDRKFIDKGWTVLPTEKVLKKMNMYKMHPAKPEFDWFERNKGKGLMKYNSGEKLAEVTTNGRGKWYYKNGKIALDYYESEDVNAQQRVVVYSSGEPDSKGRSQPITVLGMFDHMGSGVVFDHHGKIRLKYNQNEGVILDRELGPVTHWLWHSLNEPPELEQVMIDTQLPFKEPNIAKLGELDPDKTRPPDVEMVAIELDNLAKARNTKPTQKFVPHHIRMKALKINNQFSLKVLDQKTIYLLFRDGLNTMKLNLGMTLDDTEILDTRTAEVHDVSVDIEKKPSLTDSVADLQRSLINAQRLHRVRTERELKTVPPVASADRLTAAVSKPLRAPLITAADPSNHSKCRSIPATNNVYYNTRLI